MGWKRHLGSLIALVLVLASQCSGDEHSHKVMLMPMLFRTSLLEAGGSIRRDLLGTVPEVASDMSASCGFKSWCTPDNMYALRAV